MNKRIYNKIYYNKYELNLIQQLPNTYFKLKMEKASLINILTF